MGKAYALSETTYSQVVDLIGQTATGAKTSRGVGARHVSFVKITGGTAPVWDGDVESFDASTGTYVTFNAVKVRTANSGEDLVTDKRYPCIGSGYDSSGNRVYVAYKGSGGGGSGDGCTLEDRIGDGLIPTEGDDCMVSVYPGCGLEIGAADGDGYTVVQVKPSDLAGPGLAVGSGCALTVKLPALGGLLVINEAGELVVNADWLDDQLGPVNCVEVVTSVTCEDNELVIETKYLRGRFQVCADEPDPCEAGGC